MADTFTLKQKFRLGRFRLLATGMEDKARIAAGAATAQTAAAPPAATPAAPPGPAPAGAEATPQETGFALYVNLGEDKPYTDSLQRVWEPDVKFTTGAKHGAEDGSTKTNSKIEDKLLTSCL